MSDNNVITLNKPEQNDPLQEVLREGARKMLAAAIEAEVATFIDHRKGYLQSHFESGGVVDAHQIQGHSHWSPASPDQHR